MNPIVKFYVLQIKMKKIRIDDVPLKWKEQVIEELITAEQIQEETSSIEEIQEENGENSDVE